MENSKIAWTHHTFNGVIGCTRWSDGCVHCYAMEQDNRRLYGPESNWGPGAPRYIPSDNYWAAPHKWDREAHKYNTRKRVFRAS
jgi:protein gp37